MLLAISVTPMGHHPSNLRESDGSIWNLYTIKRYVHVLQINVDTETVRTRALITDGASRLTLALGRAARERYKGTT
jgi:hypothetical protein